VEKVHTVKKSFNNHLHAHGKYLPRANRALKAPFCTSVSCGYGPRLLSKGMPIDNDFLLSLVLRWRQIWFISFLLGISLMYFCKLAMVYSKDPLN
jgi:hypothetical protein